MDSLVVRYWLITGLHFDTKPSFLRRDVCEGWFGARALLSSICFAFMEIICPLLFSKTSFTQRGVLSCVPLPQALTSLLMG